MCLWLVGSLLSNEKIQSGSHVNCQLQSAWFLVCSFILNKSCSSEKEVHKLHLSVCVVTAVIEEASSKPFGVDPQVMMSIVKGLYSLNPGKIFVSCQFVFRVVPSV